MTFPLEMLSTRRLRAAVDWRTSQSYSSNFEIVPADGISAANYQGETFGTFSSYEQISDKLSNLPV
jgi:hypothetical protein